MFIYSWAPTDVKRIVAAPVGNDRDHDVGDLISEIPGGPQSQSRPLADDGIKPELRGVTKSYTFLKNRCVELLQLGDRSADSADWEKTSGWWRRFV